MGEYVVVPNQFAPIEYTIGTEPDFSSFGAYLFSDNACGLRETILVSGLPESGFVDHRAEQKDFVLTSTDNVDDAGLYTVTIMGVLEGPGDFHSDQVSFEIHVSPCQVINFTTHPSFTAEYILGSDEKVFGQYLFTQSPACGYDPTYTISWIPSEPIGFIEHDPDSQNFKIPSTSDISFVGDYTIQVTAQIV